MIRPLAPRLVAALFVLVTAAYAAPIRFEINATYHGGISLDFGSIGATTLDFQPQADGAIRVTGSGRVHHPREKEKILEFALDMAFRVEGNWVRTVWSRNTANENGKSLLEKIERILPFVHVATIAGAGERHYYTRQGVLGVTSTRDGDALRTVVEDGPRTMVTFRLRRTASGSLAVAGFEVPTKEGALLNFAPERPLDFARLSAEE